MRHWPECEPRFSDELWASDTPFHGEFNFENVPLICSITRQYVNNN
jgi:hypothetical protein